MKVILKQDVKGLGKKDSMVEVSDGYGRNYLLPRGIAVEATSSNVNVMKMKAQAEKTKKEKEFDHARSIADKLKNITVVVKAKAGENGKLFGSITSKDIADKLLKDFKVDIDRRKIQLDEPIRALGNFDVEVKIYPEVSGRLKISVVNE